MPMDLRTDILARAIAIGMGLHQKMIMPESDYISKNKACRYLSQLGYSNPRRLLDGLVKCGKIKLRKAGTARNCKVTLSAVELQKAVLAMTLDEIDIETTQKNQYGKERKGTGNEGRQALV